MPSISSEKFMILCSVFITFRYHFSISVFKTTKPREEKKNQSKNAKKEENRRSGEGPHLWNKFTKIHFRDVIDDKIANASKISPPPPEKNGILFVSPTHEMNKKRKSSESELKTTTKKTATCLLVYCIEMLKFPLHIKYWATVILL